MTRVIWVNWVSLSKETLKQYKPHAADLARFTYRIFIQRSRVGLIFISNIQS